MGANCCRFSRESYQDSIVTLADLQARATDLEDIRVEEAIDDAGPSEQGPPTPTSLPSESKGKLVSVSLESQEETSSFMPSNIFWITGSFSEPIPNGLYSVIMGKKLKQVYNSIPTLDELHELVAKSLQVDVILVDHENDEKVSNLKKLLPALAIRLNSKPAQLIKKIAQLVVDTYKRPNTVQSPSNTKGIQLLGKIRHGSSHTRAILFKVLADSVGLESTLVVGLPRNGASSSAHSYNHMSVMVVLISEEMLVDLKRAPGNLISLGHCCHISKTRQSDSAETDYCQSPNSPISERDEALQMHRKLVRSLLERKLSVSRSEPIIATESWLWTTGSRAVQRMSETSKQNRLLEERGDDVSSPFSVDDRTGSSDLQENEISPLLSPQNYQRQSCEIGEYSPQNVSHIWNEVQTSPMFVNKPLLPYKEWSIDFSELTIGDCVGIGYSGEVFGGTWNGTQVAIKLFKQDPTENIEDFCNEISIHSRIRHPNVVLFLGACIKPPRVSLVTEFMEKGSLYHVLHLSSRKKSFSWSKKINILRDICRGLMCLHRMGIVHRDLKSANCLVSKTWRVKICDFGLSKFMTDKSSLDSVASGTPEWMAPELIRNERLSEKSDIFSFGVIMWELSTLTKPWKDVRPERVIPAVAIEGSRLEIPEGPLSKLIADCWLEPEQRPSCSDILTFLDEIENSLKLIL